MGNSPEGHWSVAGVEFSIERHEDAWWVTSPGLGDDLGSLLEERSGSWVLDGGPAHGAEISFDGDKGAIGGVIPVRRLAEPPTAQPGEGIPPPAFTADPSRDAEFERIWESAKGPIDWDSSYPKHAFVQWLMARQEVVFHGSNRPGIATFSTVRESVEIDDPTGRGNLQAVYATHDGLWASYFAVVDRSSLRGSLRNGVAEYRTKGGERRIRYFLSLADVDLERRPFKTGTLYMLPRSSFAPIPLYPGGPPTPEWACHEPVAPLASLEIHPHEYPLLESIGGHDETDRIRYADAAEAIISLVTEVLSVDPELRVRLTGRPPADVIDEYVARGAVVWPGTERAVDGDLLIVRGPAEYRKALAARFRE